MVRDIFSAINAYGKAVQLLFKLRLWPYFFLPAIVSAVLGGIIMYTAWSYSDNLGSYLVSWYPWETGRSVVEEISGWLTLLILLGLGLLLFRHIVLILLGPFMSPLSQKIEEYLAGKPDFQPKFSVARTIREIVRGIRISLRLIYKELFFTLILLLLSFIPGLAIITAPLIFIVQAYYAGFGNMDFTLERHFGVKGSVDFVRKNKGIALGIGIPFILMLMTLFGFLFALPFSTAAATIETTRKLGVATEHETL